MGRKIPDEKNGPDKNPSRKFSSEKIPRFENDATQFLGLAYILIFYNNYRTEYNFLGRIQGPKIVIYFVLWKFVIGLREIKWWFNEC